MTTAVNIALIVGIWKLVSLDVSSGDAARPSGPPSRALADPAGWLPPAMNEPEKPGIVNGGFEDGTNGWAFASGARAAADDDVSRTDFASLRVRAEGGIARAYQTVRFGEEGTWQLSAQLKTALDGSTPDVARALSAGIRVRGEGFDACDVRAGAGDWREVAVLFRVRKPGTAVVGLEVAAADGAAGTAWFDDVVLSLGAPVSVREQVGPPPPRAPRAPKAPGAERAPPKPKGEQMVEDPVF